MPVSVFTMPRFRCSRWAGACILIEDTANGPAVIQTLRRTVSGIVPIKPEGGKESRAQAASPQIESGNVFLPDGASWLGDFVEECAAFPRGKHDDQVDALTQALNHVGTMSNGFERLMTAMSIDARTERGLRLSDPRNTVASPDGGGWRTR